MDPEPLSPELALVDPELARRARERLVERHGPAAARGAGDVAPATETPLFAFVEPLPRAPVPDRSGRFRKRATVIRTLVVLVAGLAVALVLFGWNPLRHLTGESRQPRDAAVKGVRQHTGAAPRVATSSPGPKARSDHVQRTARSQLNDRTETRSARAARAAAPQAAQHARAFGWAPVPRATHYLVQFYRNGKEIFEARPTAPRLVVPARWTFKGHSYTLGPGRYVWSVRPGFGRESQRRYGTPAVRAELVIQRGSNG
jgi:hypothetical protein